MSGGSWRPTWQTLPMADRVQAKAWGDLVMVTVGILVLVVLPLVLGFDARPVNVALYVAVYAVLALGLNVVVGYVGLLDLGYVTFLATGAVIGFVLLLLVQTPDGWAVPMGTAAASGWHPFAGEGGFLLILLIAGMVCAGLGALRGIPTLKLTGDYYAIVTLGLAEIVYLVYLNESWFTGGAFGMKLDFASRPVLAGEKLYYDTPAFYALVMAVLVVTVVVMERLDRSRIGRAWAAIRVDETAARHCGINVDRHKMLAFAISGFFGGVGGALYAVWSGTVAVKVLDVWQSILILCAVVLGGMGSLRGVLVGAGVLFALRELLREELIIGDWSMRVPPEASFLVYGLLLVFVMRFRPQGIIPRTSGRRPHSDAKAGGELFVLGGDKPGEPCHG